MSCEFWWKISLGSKEWPMYTALEAERHLEFSKNRMSSSRMYEK